MKVYLLDINVLIPYMFIMNYRISGLLKRAGAHGPPVR